MAKRIRNAGSNVGPFLQIKIALAEAQPPIWRRVLARPSMPLDELHYLIQDAMGWANSHLHEFVAGGTWMRGFVRDGTSYSDKRFDEEEMHEDETAVTVGDFLRKPGDTLAYVYDFGDNWAHRIELEEILQKAPRNRRVPCCLGGERACPPDDCGGVHGYAELLAVLADPNHEEHADMVAWVAGMVEGDGPFEPDAFDLAKSNRRIHSSPSRAFAEWAAEKEDMPDESRPAEEMAHPDNHAQLALLAVGKAQVDAFFRRRDAHMIDDSEFLPLLELMIEAFAVSLDEAAVEELWCHAFYAYDTLCKENDPEISSEENLALMQSYLLGPRGRGLIPPPVL